MLIANTEINYKNVITKVGDSFICSDEEVIKRLKKNGSINDTDEVKSVVKKTVRKAKVSTVDEKNL